MWGSYSQQFFALLEFLRVKAAQNVVHISIGIIIYCHLEVQCSENAPLKGNNFLLRNQPSAFSGHSCYFWGIDFIHFACQQQKYKCYFFIVIFSDRDRLPIETINIGNSKVLSIPSDFLIIRKNPLDGIYSILILNRINRVGRSWGRVVGICETRHRCALL